MRSAVAVVVAALTTITVSAQNNRIDSISPAAPELAAFGPFAVGVGTVHVTDNDRPDILNTKEGGPIGRYDRTLTLEIWYPAALAADSKVGGEYRAITRDPAVTATLFGQAVRDASPAHGSFPLVIISHGYPGNRYLLSHLGENLASKGYVVVSIDHKDSTYDDHKAFGSTLYNRPLDQLFVLNEMDRLGRPGNQFAGVIDASRTGIIGYSMGGYGLINTIGGGFSAASATFQSAPPNRLLAERGAANPAYQQSRDSRIKAAIAIGPWGMQNGYWDVEGLKGIRTPVLFVAGSADEVSGYAKGVRALYEGAVNADRYLLTFLNAGHNAAAPYPAPRESYPYSESLRLFPFTHYADPVWDTVRMNNILQHFATAFFGVHLQSDAAKQAYLEVVPNGKEGVYAVDKENKPAAAHTYWKGFQRGTAVGLILEHAKP